MKNLYLILVGIFFLLVTSNGFANDNEKRIVKSTRVTYLANSGFIVTVGDCNVMFDGLFQNGMGRYLEPDEQTVELIKTAQHPFNNIQLVFISNHHADHFDPYLATQFMLHNTQVKMVCPQQVINKMKIFTSDYEVIKKRIIETTPLVNSYDRLTLNDIEILACNVKHEKIENDHVENMAYLVAINGVKLFHSGDASIETLDDLKGVQLSDVKIDIAFLTDKFAVGRAALQTNKLVNARYNVLMHFDKAISDRTIQNFCERTKLFPRPHVFQIRNEYQDFFINDFFNKRVGEDSSITFFQQ